jgi:type I restriction enzyme S subunit
VPQIASEGTAESLLEEIRIEKDRLIKEKKIKRDKLDSVIFKGDDNKYYEKNEDELNCIDDEIPFDIPASWRWSRLGSVFAHNTGKALNGAGNGSLKKKYLTTSNLYWDYFDFSKVKEMNFTESEIDKCTVRHGDLLVCEGGDIGRAAIWNYDYDICIQNHIHRLRAYKAVATRYFLYVLWFYKSVGLIGGKGIGIQGLSSGALHNILLPMPPLSEQWRIVERLEFVLASIMRK